jgi:hypothetical protein
MEATGGLTLLAHGHALAEIVEEVSTNAAACSSLGASADSTGVATSAGLPRRPRNRWPSAKTSQESHEGA